MSKIDSSFKGPRCPNHGCPLTGLPSPLTPKGTGRCMISGASFDYEIDLDSKTMKRDKFGKEYADYSFSLSGDDSN